MKKCINCKKLLTNQRSKRCHSCENKRRHKLGLFGVMNLKHGKYTKKYYCIDCGGELSTNAGGKGAIRCRSCSAKERYKNHPENNPAYIDGRRIKWKKIREQCFKRDNYTCILCGAKGNTYLNCHHIINRHKCKNIFDINNLVTLCRKCHNFITSIENTELYNFYKQKFEQKEGLRCRT